MKRFGRFILILLALELILVFVLGLRVRSQLEAQPRYIGASPGVEAGRLA
ncbi:MAG: hypothetical protein QNK05_11880 [Myxococcota bacterium]|nr:hypothetical protein [Myxococcota bacterium]